MKPTYLPLAMKTEHFRPLYLRAGRVFAMLFAVIAMSGSRAIEPLASDLLVASAAKATSVSASTKKPTELRLWMTVGERRFAVTLSDNPAARAFAAQLPLVLDMDDLNANEKKVTLPKALPVNASRPGTLRIGDLMLWQTNTLVVFYVTFDSPYSYTRLGRVDDVNGLAQALGADSVRVAFSQQ